MKRIASLLMALGLAAGCASSVKPPTATIAVVGGQTSVPANTMVQLDGSGSTDPQKLTLTYLWTLLEVPTGSKAALNTTNGAMPSFFADLTGTYMVTLVVSDGSYSSPIATATITAGPCGDYGPNIGSITISQGTSAQTTDFPVPTADGGTVVDGGTLTPDAGLEDGGSGTDAGPADAGHPDGGTTGADAGSGVGELFVEAAPILLKASVVDLDTAPASCTPAIAAVYTYLWSLQAPAGSAATLSSTTAESPTFVPDVPGTYLTVLVVTDLNGHASPIQSASVIVSNCGEHQPVVTFVSITEPIGGMTDSVKATVNGVAIGTTAPDLNSPVTLTATAFSADNGVDPTTGVNCDPSNAILKTVTANWTFLSLPFGSGATLDVPAVTTGGGSPSEPTTSSAFFYPDLPGTYVIQLSAVDSAGLKSTTAPVITMSVTGCTGNQPPAVTIAGFSEAGMQLPVSNGNETDTVGDSPQLRPTVTNPNTGCTGAQTYSYAWTLLTLPAGSHATLNDATAMAPSLQLDAPGTFEVQVVVTDSMGVASSPATVTIVASASSSACGNRSPTVTATQGTFDIPWNAVAQIQANDGLPNANNPTCTGSCVVVFDTNDPDNTCVNGLSLSYAWSFTSLPAGSHAAFINPAIQNPSFTPDVANGDYTVQVVATDNRNLSTNSTVVLHSGPGGNAPEVTFSDALVAGEAGLTFQGGTGTITGGEVGRAVTFNLGGCTGGVPQLGDADNTGSICQNDSAPETFAYAWTLESSPSGSVAQLVDATSLTPSLVPDVEGTYAVQVVVTSSAGLSSVPQSVNLSVACGTSLTPVLGMGITQTPNMAIVGTGEQLSVSVSNAPEEQAALCGKPDAFTYAWSFTSIPSGSQAAIIDPAAQSPSFIPDVASATWDVQVVVTDIQGRTATATAMVTSTMCGNSPPTINTVGANAAFNTYNGAITGSNPSVTWGGGGGVTGGSPMFQLGSPITFTATATDPNGGCGSPAETLSYSWNLAALPAGSAAALSSAGSSASFTPDMPSASQATRDYVVALTVTDTAGRATTAQFGLTASSCGSFQPTVATTNASGTNPGAIDLPSQPITFTANPPATTITDQNVTGCFPAAFRVPASYSYHWTLAKAPAGSGAVLQNTDVAVASIVPDETGTYVAALVVTDATGQQSSVNPAVTGSGGVVSVDVQNDCGGAAPAVLIGATDCSVGTNTSCNGPTQAASSGTAPYCSGGGNCLTATTNITVAPGDNWLLGSLTTPANFSCLSSDTWASMSYSWAIEAAPNGFGTSQLSGAATAGATFRANAAGTFVVSLTVTNELGKSGTSSITITAQ